MRDRLDELRDIITNGIHTPQAERALFLIEQELLMVRERLNLLETSVVRRGQS